MWQLTSTDHGRVLSERPRTRSKVRAMTRKPLAFLAARDAARVLSLYLCIEPQRWWFGAPLVRPLSRVSRRRIRHRPDLRAHVECYWMPVWRSRRGIAWAMAWDPRSLHRRITTVELAHRIRNPRTSTTSSRFLAFAPPSIISASFLS